MTTALLWWAGVMALTWGLVVATRSWRWSPGRDDASELRTRDLTARIALLPVVVLLGVVTFVSFTFLGWSTHPPGVARLGEAVPVLVVCAATGLGIACCLLTIAGRRVRSWWLLAGLLPALIGASLALGV